MDIKIKEPKKLKELAKEFHRTPTSFINDIIEGFAYPPGFKEEVRKNSFRFAFARALWRSYYGQKLEEEIYEVLGKYDYHIEDGEIDLQKRTCWFSLAFSADEKHVDLDSVHVQLDEGSAALVTVTRTIDQVSLDGKKLKAAEKVAWEELSGEFSDAPNVEFEFWDPMSDNEITMELRVDEEHFSYLPKLKELNEVMDKIEYTVRKILK